MANFMERGYTEHFGYGAFKHCTRNEMLLLDDDVFGPACSDRMGDGRRMVMTAPDGTATVCYGVWDAMAKWLSDRLGREVPRTNMGVEHATFDLLASKPELEPAMLDFCTAAVGRLLQMKDGCGHPAHGDLADTGSAALILDMDAPGTDRPYWGTIELDGDVSGQNRYGRCLERARKDFQAGKRSWGNHPGYAFLDA